MSEQNKRGGARKGAGRPKSEPTYMVRVPEGCLDEVKRFISLYRDYTANPDFSHDVYWFAKGSLSAIGSSNTHHAKFVDKDGQTDWVGKK